MALAALMTFLCKLNIEAVSLTLRSIRRFCFMRCMHNTHIGTGRACVHIYPYSVHYIAIESERNMPLSLHSIYNMPSSAYTAYWRLFNALLLYLPFPMVFVARLHTLQLNSVWTCLLAFYIYYSPFRSSTLLVAQPFSHTQLFWANGKATTSFPHIHFTQHICARIHIHTRARTHPYTDSYRTFQLGAILKSTSNDISALKYGIWSIH